MEYSELADLFPRIYEETECKPVPDFFRRESGIPKILHYIWLGEKPLPEKFRQNMDHFSSRMREFGGVAVLWTDQKKIESACRLVDVDSVFGNRESMATFIHYKAALAKVPPNFGEAGDLLRFEIIDRFGGYYLDCDIEEKDVDLGVLLSLGAGSPHGFVSGYCPVGKFSRNDMFGASRNSPIIKSCRELILNNYKTKIWNRRVTHSRPFLLDFTIVTTGPDVFKETVARFDVKTFVISPMLSSAESWVYDHANPKPIRFKSDRDDRIKHDLMLNLIYKEQILDLEKYRSYCSQEALVSFVEEHPELVESVDRIFIGDVALYCRLQKNLSKRSWNEQAALKFAFLAKKSDLIRYLVSERGVNPSAFEDVGFYGSL